MPTERFFHLPEEKRARILDAAVREMTAHPVGELSINRIIQNADIPRGSFYQYFEDKNDLITFILEDFKGMLQRRMGELVRQEGSDLISVFYQMVQEAVDFGLKEDRALFFKNTVAHIFSSGDTASCVFLFKPQELLQAWWPDLSLTGYRRQDQQFLEDLTDLLFVLTKHTVARIFSDPPCAQEEMRALERKLAMIREGVLIPGEEKKNV